ncbi:MAG: hypothetical protein ACOVK2_04780 [Candidatus Fonsibacter sp.]
MKNYKIEISTDVYVDSWKDGELDYVNCFTNSFEIVEVSPIKAIEKAMDKLCFSFDKKYMQLDEESETICFYSNLVNEENEEVNKTDIEYKEWKKGKKALYSANHRIEVKELINTKIY